MMADYIALSWNQRSEAAAAQHGAASDALRAAGWQAAHQRRGLSVWTSAGGVVPVSERVPGLVVIGRIYSGPPTALSALSTPKNMAQQLCRATWGAYIAILSFGEDSAAWVFRDPSGALEALTWRRGELGLVASALGGVPAALQPPKMALDWDVIGDFIDRPGSLAGRIGLAGVAPVTPGFAQPIGGSASEAIPIWRPSDWVSDDLQLGDRSDDLFETVTRTVGLMAESHQRLAVEVSGGLDSSIVAACLATMGFSDRVTFALNYIGDRPEGDESTWARMLCRRHDLPLTTATRPLNPIDPESAFAGLADDVRPPVGALDAWRDADTAGRLANSGASALMTGVGGDGVFFQMPSPGVAEDLRRELGWRAWRDPRMVGLARWLRRSTWALLRDGRRLARTSARSRSPFAGPSADPSASEAEHPWLEDLEALPVGKQVQVRMVTSLQVGSRTRTSAVAEILHPLLAQPVMELCLSIPSWTLVQGGRERGLARDTFAPILPPSITNRQGKGTLTSYYARALAAGLDRFRPFLLDGVLADAGVLDRAAMEQALRPETLICRSEGLSLIRVAAIEAWARHWQTRVPDSPDAPRYRL